MTLNIEEIIKEATAELLEDFKKENETKKAIYDTLTYITNEHLEHTRIIKNQIKELITLIEDL